jgi:hypothetical protein
MAPFWGYSKCKSRLNTWEAIYILVDSDVIDLINPNNVTVAADQSYKPIECFKYQTPIDQLGILYQCSSNQRPASTQQYQHYKSYISVQPLS